MKVKADREESSPYAGLLSIMFINLYVITAMLAAIDVVNRCKELKINALHIKLRARGGKSFVKCIDIFFY